MIDYKLNGYSNIKTDGVPNTICYIRVIVNEKEIICIWVPYDPKNLLNPVPSTGYLGLAKKVDLSDVKFYVFEQNESGFINFLKENHEVFSFVDEFQTKINFFG